MIRKKCYKCLKTRLVKYFNKRKASKDGLQKVCKDCSRLQSKDFYFKNKQLYKDLYLKDRETILNRNKKWNKNNRDKVIQHKQKFMSNNPDYYSKYRKENKKILNRKTSLRDNFRRKTDILFKLQKNYRNRLYDYYRGTNRSKRSEEIIGLSWTEFKIYLENKFLIGMTWENYGEWHIDHIIPLASANSPKELENLFHYTNCQPLWAKDNILKGAKLF